jgi:DNA polymerase-3 subunit delta'
MSSAESFREAFEGLRQSLNAGRVAHGYLLVGYPRGAALLLAESFLQLLFCGEPVKPCGHCAPCMRIQKREHPDVVWVEPESKSRRIPIDKIRDDIIVLFNRKSYEGGWKAAVIIGADRLTEEAANALLKTLEEPPGRGILLLLTDAVQYLRPTIVSRCQRILLNDSGERAVESAPWRHAVIEILRQGPAQDFVTARRYAAQLKAVLDEVKKNAEAALKGAGGTEELSEDELNARIAARMLAERAEILRVIQLWKRDVLLAAAGVDRDKFFFADDAEVIVAQAKALSYAGALREVQSVQRMADQLEQHLPPEMVLAAGLSAGSGRS